MYETLIYEKNNGVVTLSLNRPSVLNAFDGQLHQDLHDCVGQRDDGRRSSLCRAPG